MGLPPKFGVDRCPVLAPTLTTGSMNLEDISSDKLQEVIFRFLTIQ
jgi:hypothetical protein